MPQTQDKCDQVTLASLGCACVIGTCLRVHEIQRISYWFDESSSWKTISFTWAEMFSSISKNVHPPFFYIVLKSWGSVFGTEPVRLRLFSIAFGVLAIPAIAWLIWECLVTDQRVSPARRRVAVLCGAILIATSPMHVMLSSQLRMYSLGAFLVLLSAIFLIRLSAGRGSIWCNQIALGVSLTSLTLTHYYGLFSALVFAIGTLFLSTKPPISPVITDQSSRWKPPTIVVVGLIGLLPWVFWARVLRSQVLQVQRDYWIADVSQSGFLAAMQQLTGASYVFPESATAAWLSVVIAAAVTIVMVSQPRFSTRLSSSAFAVPLFLAIVVSLVGKSIFVPRYLLFAQTFLLVCVSLLMGSLVNNRLREALIVSTLAWSSLCAFQCIKIKSSAAMESGLREACVVANSWSDEDSIIWVAAPTIHPTVQRYAVDPSTVYVAPGEFEHYLGSPILRKNEIASSAEICNSGLQKVIAFDVSSLYQFGASDLGRQLQGWKVHRSQYFNENYGHSCQIRVRELRRHSSGPEVNIRNKVTAAATNSISF